MKANTYKPGYQWYMHVYNKTFQPYADLTWKPLPQLTIEAGVKDSNFTIDLEAPLNQGTEAPDFSNNTYTNIEPHFSANFAFTPNWSAYVQVAKGIAYPIVTDEENVPNDAKDTSAGGTPYNPGNLKEEQTVNYQLGTVYKTDRFNADADVYLIDINNLVSSVTDPNDSTNTLYFQSKGAWVSGLEVEGTYYVGDGLSVYANGSLNRAVFKTNPGVPGFNVASLGAFGGGYVPNSTASVRRGLQPFGLVRLGRRQVRRSGDRVFERPGESRPGPLRPDRHGARRAHAHPGPVRRAGRLRDDGSRRRLRAENAARQLCSFDQVQAADRQRRSTGRSRS